jgi:hypothetical protein
MLTLEDWEAEIGTVQGLDLPALLGERASTPVDEEEMHRARRALCADLLACRALDVEPRDALALEDSSNGIAAAKAAGLACVAVPNSITQQLDLGAADVVIRSLADQSLADVLETLSTT